MPSPHCWPSLCLPTLPWGCFLALSHQCRVTALPCQAVSTELCQAVLCWWCHARATPVLCQVVLCQSQCHTVLVPRQQVLTAPCAHRCVHGLCLPLDALSYSCQCHEGYQGALCNQPAEPPDPCRHHPCVHGHCHLSPAGQPACECHDGYTGALCDQGRCWGAVCPGRAAPRRDTRLTTAVPQSRSAAGSRCGTTTRCSGATPSARRRGR